MPDSIENASDMKALRHRWHLGLSLIGLWAFPAQAELIPLSLKAGSVLGSSYQIRTQYGETVPMLAQVHEVGYHELLWANPTVHSWMPGDGAVLRIPRRFILPGRRREGIVLNLAEMRLYYYETSGTPQVHTYPISVGRVDWSTPVGVTRVVSRLEDPAWYPPASVRREHAERGDPLPSVVPPGSDNPLGKHALQLSKAGYFIHGTNRSQGIGMRVTHGCVRLRNQDIADLFHRVPVGTPVEIVSMPVKVGLRGGFVYMEAHPLPREEMPMPEKAPVLDEVEVSVPLDAVENQLPPGNYIIYWEQAMEIAREARGVPSIIGWSRNAADIPKGRPELLLHVPDRGEG